MRFVFWIAFFAASIATTFIAQSSSAADLNFGKLIPLHREPYQALSMDYSYKSQMAIMSGKFQSSHLFGFIPLKAINYYVRIVHKATGETLIDWMEIRVKENTIQPESLQEFLFGIQGNDLIQKLTININQAYIVLSLDPSKEKKVSHYIDLAAVCYARPEQFVNTDNGLTPCTRDR